MFFPEAAQAGCRIVSTPVGIAPEMGAVCGFSEGELAVEVLDALRLPNGEMTNEEMATRFSAADTAAAYLDLYARLNDGEAGSVHGGC